MNAELDELNHVTVFRLAVHEGPAQVSQCLLGQVVDLVVVSEDADANMCEENLAVGVA